MRPIVSPRALASPCRPRRSLPPVPAASPTPPGSTARAGATPRRPRCLRRSVFLEVLVSGTSSRRISRRNRDAAAWRAGEPSAAAREGRAPPPPPNTDEDPDPASAGTGNVFETAGARQVPGSTSWGAHRRGTLAGNNPRRAFRVSAEYHLGTHSVPAAAVVSQPGDDGERDRPGARTRAIASPPASWTPVRALPRHPISSGCLVHPRTYRPYRTATVSASNTCGGAETRQVCRERVGARGRAHGGG